MKVHELGRGFWYWLAPHPAWDATEDWPEHVPGADYESPDEIVLIDPLVPRGEEEEFWRGLDADLERVGLPLRVLLTAPCHRRDTARIVERYGARVWAPPRARWRHGAVLTTTADLPRGVEALLPDGDQDQALFFVRSHRTLITGDIFSERAGRLKVFVDEQDREPFLAWLPHLCELPIERVVVAHGDPILADGAARVREAVAEVRR